MMIENMVPLCKSAQTSLAQTMWPRIEHPLTRMKECQAQALSVESLSEGLLHSPSLVFRPPPLLRDVSLPAPGPMFVVSLLV